MKPLGFVVALLMALGIVDFVRIHPSLRVTPAMAAGVSDRLWFIEELIDIASDGRDAA